MTAREIDIHTLPSMLTALRLPSFHKLWAEIATPFYNKAGPTPKAGPPPGPPGLLRPSFDPPDRMIACRDRARSLAVLAEYELAERDMRRIRRHLNEAQLPTGKTLATFDFKALPTLPHARVEALAAGDWLESGGNLIAIGNSGTGKTHILCAIGHALIEAGHRVFYARTSDLVQKLQVARRDLVLEAALAKLDRFDLIILDDITYAHKDQAETGVLFELIARRYEYRSIAIAANQPFSGWNQIFPDKAMTVAAIDRLVHHATILEMNGESFRQRAAASNKKAQAETPATTINDNQDEGEN